VTTVSITPPKFISAIIFIFFVRLAVCGAAGYTCPYGCELYSYPKRACLIRPPPIQEGGSGFILIF
jgi:hypothetical protein